MPSPNRVFSIIIIPFSIVCGANWSAFADTNLPAGKIEYAYHESSLGTDFKSFRSKALRFKIDVPASWKEEIRADNAGVYTVIFSPPGQPAGGEMAEGFQFLSVRLQPAENRKSLSSTMFDLKFSTVKQRESAEKDYRQMASGSFENTHLHFIFDYFVSEPGIPVERLTYFFPAIDEMAVVEFSADARIHNAKPEFKNLRRVYIESEFIRTSFKFLKPLSKMYGRTIFCEVCRRSDYAEAP